MKDESTMQAETIVSDYGLAWEMDWFEGQREDLIFRVAAALREQALIAEGHVNYIGGLHKEITDLRAENAQLKAQLADANEIIEVT